MKKYLWHSILIIFMLILLSSCSPKEGKEKYDYLGSFRNGLAPVSKDGKSGFINREGELQVPLIYDECEEFYNNLAKVKKDGLYGYVDIAGKETVPVKFQDIQLWSYGYEKYIIKENNLYGLYSPYYGYYAEPIYKFIDWLDTENILVTTTDNKVGMIDYKGNIIIEPKYAKIEKFDDRCLIVTNEEDLSGLIDMRGTIVIDVMYKEIIAAKYEDDRIILRKKNGKFYLGDMRGDPITEEKYDSMDSVGDDRTIQVCNKGKYGLIDLNGNLIVEPKYMSIDKFHEGLAKVCNENGEYGFIDTSGNIVIECKYSYGIWFNNGVALVKLGDKWGGINRTGEIIVPIEHENIGNPTFNGISMCKRIDNKSLWGLYDYEGNLTIPYKYEEPINLFRRKEIVKRDGLYGVINEKGQEILEVKYPELEFFGDFFKGKINDKNLILDSEGSVLTNIEFHEISEISGILREFKVNEKYGFMDKDFNVIIEPIYEEVGDFSEGLIPVKLEGKWMYIDYSGKEVLLWK